MGNKNHGKDGKFWTGSLDEMWPHRHKFCPAVQKTHSFPWSNLISYSLITWAPASHSFIHLMHLSVYFIPSGGVTTTPTRRMQGQGTLLGYATIPLLGKEK